MHPGDDTERLLAEARTLAQLEHPGIVPIHDAGLRNEIRRRERLDPFVVGTVVSERVTNIPANCRGRGFRTFS